MILVIIFLFLVLVCFSVLIYSKTEDYKRLYDLGLLQELEKRVLNDEHEKKIKKKLTGGAKYGYGSDYDKMHQKRAKGSNRDTGDDR